jgi:hypothetical protein
MWKSFVLEPREEWSEPVDEAAACSRQLSLRCPEIMRHNAHMGPDPGSDCPSRATFYMYGVPSKADCTPFVPRSMSPRKALFASSRS